MVAGFWSKELSICYKTYLWKNGVTQNNICLKSRWSRNKIVFLRLALPCAGCIDGPIPAIYILIARNIFWSGSTAQHSAVVFFKFCYIGDLPMQFFCPEYLHEIWFNGYDNHCVLILISLRETINYFMTFFIFIFSILKFVNTSAKRNQK